VKKYLNIYFVLGVAFIVILLGCMLSYPFGYDQSVFAVGGETVLKNGAFPGKDFLDTKPPLIFYIYSIAIGIFGHHQWSIRALDIIYHLISLTYFFLILKRIFKQNENILLIIITYVVLYASSGFWMTAQAESFTLLPSLIIFDMAMRYETTLEKRNNLFLYSSLIALSIFVLILLKYTLVFSALGLATYFIFNSKCKAKDRVLLISTTASFVAAFLGLYGFYLNSIGALDDTFLGIKWVANYAAIDPLFSLSTIKNQFFLSFPQSFISTLTPLIFISLILGIWDRKRSSSSQTSFDRLEDEGRFYSFLLWQIFFGLLGIMLERKNFVYTYTRILWAFTPFIVIGIKLIWEKFSLSWKTSTDQFILNRIKIIILLCIALFFSPITKLISQPLQWSWITLSSNEDFKLKKLSTEGFEEAIEIDTLAINLRPLLRNEDNILFWGNTVDLYFELHKTLPTICLTNTPLVSTWTPEKWKNKFLLQLYNSQPKIIVSQVGDIRPKINGNITDSYNSLLNWDKFQNYVAVNYHEISGTNHFKVFIRNL
jgi:4-amino-4-deoxy-L-arabinose transferase-like glycosyltransferase